MSCFNYKFNQDQNLDEQYQFIIHNSQFTIKSSLFGLKLAGMSFINGTENKYTYNGKEHYLMINDELLMVNSSKFITYNSKFNICAETDLADEFHSPYVYCANNPVMLIDPDGCEANVSKNLQYAFYLMMSTESGKKLFSDYYSKGGKYYYTTYVKINDNPIDGKYGQCRLFHQYVEKSNGTVHSTAIISTNTNLISKDFPKPNEALLKICYNLFHENAHFIKSHKKGFRNAKEELIYDYDTVEAIKSGLLEINDKLGLEVYDFYDWANPRENSEWKIYRDTTPKE